MVRSKPPSFSAASQQRWSRTEERFARREVDEVARLGPAEQRHELVGGELLQREHGSDRARLRGQQPVVDAQVDLGLIVTAG